MLKCKKNINFYAKSLHKMIKYTSVSQLSIAEFEMPFEARLDPTNRWVVLSPIIPWDNFANLYYRKMSSGMGAPAIDARVVLGTIIIKHLQKLDDRGTIEIIQENPYMQYFLGLKGFTSKPVFDPSLLVTIRKRLDIEVFESLTDDLIKRYFSQIESVQAENDNTDNPEDNPPSTNKTDSTIQNKGKLQLDATVADADIKYPTDLDLLNDSREKSEELIDFLCRELELKKKPRTYRQKARKEFLNVSKKKNKSRKELRKAIGKQIRFLRRNLGNIDSLIDQQLGGHVPFDKRQYKYYLVIRHLLTQQEEMFRNKKRSCEHRIVSIHQPHVRPIVRGKTKAKVEFGAKINVSLQYGFARIDHADWEAFNEGGDLKQQVERYKTLFRHYPELVQVDRIYLTRDNRNWLKERNIRYTGKPLGRTPTKTKKSKEELKQQRKELAERNHIEGKFGQGKNGYNLNHIRARLARTSLSWIAAIFFVMNLIRFAKSLFLSVISQYYKKWALVLFSKSGRVPIYKYYCQAV